MDAIESFLSMGGYAAYVWPAYGVAVIVLAVLIVVSVRQLRANERESAAMEADRPRRRATTGDTADEA